ncbi:MAG TPA: sugar phosphate isomerase/epimerase [Tepidisphaeraceae bacterium]|nr:sugar phosphate isomerase/epimerase [Tepidisphaeraceae bacterium]
MLPTPKLPALSFQPITLQKKYSLETEANLILDRLKSLDIMAIEGGPDDPVEFKKKLDARGMKSSGLHIALHTKPDAAKTIDYLQKVGATDVCNSGLLRWDKPDLACYRDSIKSLNNLGQQLKSAGIQLHYHNHAFEFEKVDGEKTGMDVLMDGLDPNAVDFCMDVAWIWRGDRDPASYLLQHKDRITYLHLKDTTKDEWCPLGQGKLDMPSIVNAIRQMPNVNFAAIEQDVVIGEPWDAVKTSREYLMKTFGW